MNSPRRVSRKCRVSTRDRFVSVLHGGTVEADPSPPWYRRNELFWPLLVIFIFFVLAFVVKIIVQVQNLQAQSLGNQSGIDRPVSEPESEEGEMSYEEAKKILGGS